MIKRILKVLLFSVLGIVLVLLLFYVYVSWDFNQRAAKSYVYDVTVPNISYDSASLALGAHLSVIKGCRDCHNDDLGGRVMIDDPALGRVVPTNLTKGGVGAQYSLEDWVRALRHGIGPDQKPLLFMPAHETANMTDKDLAALIAYCTQSATVTRELPSIEIRPVGKLLNYFGKMHMFPVEMIDHDFIPPADMDKSVSPEFGEYLAVTCTGCHYSNFKGGSPQVPGSPPVPDITSTGNLANWTEGEFMQTLRTGTTPQGKMMQNEFMPWKMTSEFTDEELKSLYLYLKDHP
ncbi:cytochrome c553 [Catalinimonas alkaloidigena]|uniref:c-type cytochrome n=1 Tax=Catalinimonas alkaloidigena TaxID=1075417 RepID=UPI002405E5E0|nr:c-type cytochrome [Catalinimonas alkaloidigena]MDF9794925.1 cytochrome c553 [Catalinimonas alkaloidigena]